jgi:hypothetical protein
MYGLSFVCVLAATGFAWVLRRRKPLKRSVAIVVLGDIGRSPRMMYHAESFLNAGFKTYVVGYGGNGNPLVKKYQALLMFVLKSRIETAPFLA